MSKAEQAAKEIYKDGIKLVGRRDRNNNIVIHPEIMVGILRNAAAKGYEQAEKDTIEKAYDWLCSHAASYIGLAQMFKKAMEEE